MSPFLHIYITFQALSPHPDVRFSSFGEKIRILYFSFLHPRTLSTSPFSPLPRVPAEEAGEQEGPSSPAVPSPSAPRCPPISPPRSLLKIPVFSPTAALLNRAGRTCRYVQFSPVPVIKKRARGILPKPGILCPWTERSASSLLPSPSPSTAAQRISPEGCPPPVPLPLYIRISFPAFQQTSLSVGRNP